MNDKKQRRILEQLRHTLCFLNGVYATDRPDLFDVDAHKNTCWRVDCENELKLIDDLLMIGNKE